eukprot:gene26799-4390_t
MAFPRGGTSPEKPPVKPLCTPDQKSKFLVPVLVVVAVLAGKGCSRSSSLTAMDEEGDTDVYIPDHTQWPRVVLRAHLPVGYPSSVPPLVEVQASHLSDDLVEWTASQALKMFEPGQVLLYNFFEWAKEQSELTEPVEGRKGQGPGGQLDGELGGLRLNGGDDHHGSETTEEDNEDWQHDVDEELDRLAEHARRDYGSGVDGDEAKLKALVDRIQTGEPVTERKSTFQAHVCQVTSYEEVKMMVGWLLQSSNKIRNASHNIMAYRIELPDKPDSLLQDYDDDGESAAGGRLLRLLQASDARDVVVVVSRWFGGILLGLHKLGYM